MSGPKVSVYELSAAQRKIFYEQLEIIKQTETNLQQILRGMTNLQSEVDVLAGSIEKGVLLAEETKQVCSFAEIQNQIEKILKQIELCEKEYERIKEAYRVDKTGTVEMSQAMNQERTAKLEALQKLNATISENVKLVKKLQKEALKEIEAIDASLKAELQDQILGGFSLSFATIKRSVEIENGESKEFDSEDEKRREEEREKLHSYQDKIFEALISVTDSIDNPERLSPVLADKLKVIKAKAAEITSVDFIENFYAISVIPFVKECHEYVELLARFDEAYMRYEFLCDEAGLVAKKYAVTEDSIVMIQAEIEKLEEQDAESQTKAFIANVIDEAMKEMGYDLVGQREVTKKSGRKIKHGLYHFGEGTGVDVTFSGDGQITMELGGFDEQDRTPDEREADILCEDMQRFCGEYAALERLLEKKGVKRKNIQMLPPIKEYAQIINTRDYKMLKPVSKLHSKKTQKTGLQVRHTE